LTIKEAYHQFCTATQAAYPIRETLSMARIIFEDEFGVTNFDRIGAFSEEQQDRLQHIQGRLLQQEPLQYILEQADFYGLKFKVSPAVLIPRPETEELVYWILGHARLSVYNPALKVLDIGTGSGCIPITLKKELPILEVHATDISNKVLEVAQWNARANNTSVYFKEHDILKEEVWGQIEQYDIIVSNPPYIPNAEKALMPDNVKDFEPHLALFVSDDDALVFYRTITKFALQHLQDKGMLFFEVNEFNAKEVVQMMEESGFVQVELKQDLSGKDRMVLGKKK